MTEHGWQVPYYWCPECGYEVAASGLEIHHAGAILVPQMVACPAHSRPRVEMALRQPQDEW